MSGQAKMLNSLPQNVLQVAPHLPKFPNFQQGGNRGNNWLHGKIISKSRVNREKMKKNPLTD